MDFIVKEESLKKKMQNYSGFGIWVWNPRRFKMIMSFCDYAQASAVSKVIHIY